MVELMDHPVLSYQRPQLSQRGVGSRYTNAIATSSSLQETRLINKFKRNIIKYIMCTLLLSAYPRIVACRNDRVLAIRRTNLKIKLR